MVLYWYFYGEKRRKQNKTLYQCFGQLGVSRPNILYSLASTLKNLCLAVECGKFYELTILPHSEHKTMTLCNGSVQN